MNEGGLAIGNNNWDQYTSWKDIVSVRKCKGRKLVLQVIIYLHKNIRGLVFTIQLMIYDLHVFNYDEEGNQLRRI